MARRTKGEGQHKHLQDCKPLPHLLCAHSRAGPSRRVGTQSHPFPYRCSSHWPARSAHALCQTHLLHALSRPNTPVTGTPQRHPCRPSHRHRRCPIRYCAEPPHDLTAYQALPQGVCWLHKRSTHNYTIIRVKQGTSNTIVLLRRVQSVRVPRTWTNDQPLSELCLTCSCFVATKSPAASAAPNPQPPPVCKYPLNHP